MAAHAHLKNAFMEDEKCDNLMSWLIKTPIGLQSLYMTHPNNHQVVKPLVSHCRYLAYTSLLTGEWNFILATMCSMSLEISGKLLVSLCIQTKTHHLKQVQHEPCRRKATGTTDGNQHSSNPAAIIKILNQLIAYNEQLQKNQYIINRITISLRNCGWTGCSRNWMIPMLIYQFRRDWLSNSVLIWTIFWLLNSACDKSNKIAKLQRMPRNVP